MDGLLESWVYYLPSPYCICAGNRLQEIPRTPLRYKAGKFMDGCMSLADICGMAPIYFQPGPVPLTSKHQQQFAVPLLCI